MNPFARLNSIGEKALSRLRDTTVAVIAWCGRNLRERLPVAASEDDRQDYDVVG